ncbi:MAG: hypothetical protein JNM82_05130, partial [Rhodocyclaceae bacterium]|nr:hypothetical protein [Rhodocyclaceae bacterium]
MTTANRHLLPRTDFAPDGRGPASARRAGSRRAARDGPGRRLGELLLALVLLFPGLSAAAVPVTVRIGILAHRGEAAAVAAYQPTADFLSERVPGPRFSVVPYDLREMELAIAMGAVDFVITNPEQ